MNETALLVRPAAVTTKFPVVALFGICAAIVVAFQEVTLIARPLTETVPEPWVDPKFNPVIVIVLPAGAAAGVKTEMNG